MVERKEIRAESPPSGKRHLDRYLCSQGGRVSSSCNKLARGEIQKGGSEARTQD